MTTSTWPDDFVKKTAERLGVEEAQVHLRFGKGLASPYGWQAAVHHRGVVHLSERFAHAQLACDDLVAAVDAGLLGTRMQTSKDPW